MSENQSEDIIKKRRAAIRGAGLTLELAAEKLGIGRNTLYAQLDKAVLDEQFIHNVRTKLSIELSELKGGNSQITPSTEPLTEFMIRQMSEAQREAMLAYKTLAEREREFNNVLVSSLKRYDEEISRYEVWKKEVGQSILTLTREVAPLLKKDRSKAVQKG